VSKEIILETTDRWEMLELLRPGLDGRYYLEDVAYGLLIFSVVNKVHALYFGGIIMTKILQSLMLRWRRR
jgi:hypothetical protein